MANPTVETIINLFLKDKDITSVDTDVLFMWLNEIDGRMYELVQKIDVYQFIKTQNIPILSGIDTYALPTDLDNMKRRGCGVFELDDNAELFLDIRFVDPTTRDSGVYISGNTDFVFTPVPVRNFTARVRYVPVRVVLIDANKDSQTIIIDERFQKLYVDWLKGLFDVRDERDTVSIQLNDQMTKEAESRLREEFRPIRRTLRLRTTWGFRGRQDSPRAVHF